MPSLKIYGLLGYPVKHSLSPAMHNAAFKSLGINAEYRLFEVHPDDLKDFLLGDRPVYDINGNSVARQQLCGFNITIPHKIKASQILECQFPFTSDDFLSLQELYYVKLSGAVNTVKVVGDRLVYYNTDPAGFIRSLGEDLKFDPKGKKVLVVGCGGAGRAVIAALSWTNTGTDKIYATDIKNEALDSAKEYFAQIPRLKDHLKDRLIFISLSDITKRIKNCDLLVNASSLGMHLQDESPLDKRLLHKG